MKLIVGDKDGKSYSVELTEEQAKAINGKALGDIIQGEAFGLLGYELKFTGGSNTSGFPMRESVSGQRNVKMLVSSKPGFKPTRHGERKRKTIVGEVFSKEISQVNCTVHKKGAKPLSEILPGKASSEKAEKKGEK